MFLDRISAYWDSRADGYSKSILGEVESGKAQTMKALLKDALPAGGHIEALDIGCGPGLFTLLLNELGAHVTSGDYSEEMLGQMKKNCENAGYTANGYRVDAQDLPFADESFDFVCSRNLVWNLEDPERAYREWVRVLRPGGRLFILDGNHYLHYYNDDFRLARELLGALSDHSTYGVDPTPINEIARDLPLSRELRPEWDEHVLSALSLKDIRIEREWRDYADEETGKSFSLTQSFVLTGTK